MYVCGVCWGGRGAHLPVKQAVLETALVHPAVASVLALSHAEGLGVGGGRLSDSGVGDLGDGVWEGGGQQLIRDSVGRGGTTIPKLVVGAGEWVSHVPRVWCVGAWVCGDVDAGWIWGLVGGLDWDGRRWR